MADESEPKPRGLWKVMRQQGESVAPDPVADQHSSSVADDEREETKSPGKGLWALMGVSSPPVPDVPEAEPAAEEESAPPPAWFRGKIEDNSPPEPEQSSAPLAEDIEEEIFEEVPVSEAEAEPEEVEVEVEEDVEHAVSQPVQPAPFVVAESASPARARLSNITVKTGRSRGAMLSLLVGLFAVPLTLLAAMPEIWTRIVPACLGFGALVLGLISFNEIQQSRGRQTGTGFAIAGMILGTLAMFLGPLVIAPWSAKQGKASGREITQTHLEQIGRSLKDYHKQFQHYPAGGTYRVEESGNEIALHSWMTDLLPYLGHQETYRQIDFNKPWDEGLNKAPLTKEIPAFLAGGVTEKYNTQGYALAHFSGVGGQVPVEGGRMANAGIFDRSSQVAQSDILDGLSQTLIAGEIPENYRPWGEPGNWRTVGEGLNRDSTSFGNAEHTGALFLHADGSVKFYSNNVSADVLKRLSTRDGEDNR